MSNFLEMALATLAGITVFYLLEALFYDIKARINGRKLINFIEDFEDEVWDN